MLSIQDGFSLYIISCTNIDLPIITTLIMDSVRFVIHNGKKGREMKNKKNLGILLAITLALASGLVVSGLLTVSRTLSSTGSVKAINVEVFWDLACTQVVSSIDWGTPEPGDSINQTVYIKNTGTAPMNLSLSTSGWVPVEAGNYLTLTWDREEAEVAAAEVIQALLTLDVSGSITGITDFSFDIVIEGTG